MKLEKYQLRCAAGMYWLLDMEQDGFDYKKPVMLNESGAFFWRLIEQGKSREQLIAYLCEEYGLQQEEAAGDIDNFLQQLKEKNINVMN